MRQNRGFVLGEEELSTKFFQMVVVANRRRNIIESITVNEVVFEREEEVKEVIVSFYEHLFKEEMGWRSNKGII